MKPKRVLLFLATLIVSALSVYAQGLFPFLSQWVFIYIAVFLISWYGGMILGMVATVFSLWLGGLYLIPSSQFSFYDFLTLMILTCLGFWVAYSMHYYKQHLEKVLQTEETERTRGFLDELLENIPLMVFVKDAKDLRFIRFNRSGLNLLGYELKDLIGKNDSDFFPPDQAKHFIAKDREVLAGQSVLDIPYEPINTRHNGERILHTKKIPVFDKKGEPLYLLGVSEDITDRVRAEEERHRHLAEDAAKLERLRIQERESFVAHLTLSLTGSLDFHETLQRLASLLVPTIADWSTITIIKEDGSFERMASFHFNPMLQPMLDEFSRLYPPSDTDKEVKLTLIEGKSFLLKNISEDFLKSRSQDDRKFHMYRDLGTRSSMSIPIKFRDRVLGALSLSRGPHREGFDELDLMMAEEIGRRAGSVIENSLLFQSTQRAVKARDEFLSIASHELKTPITALKMQLQMLQRVNGGVTIQRPLENSIRQVDRLTGLVNDLLDVGKFESGRMSYNFLPFQMGELLSEVTENFRGEFLNAGAQLIVEVQDDVLIYGDRYRLEQVIVNVLSNALKYGEQRPVRVKGQLVGQDFMISVKDEGPGIPKEFQRKIFEKFERARQDSSISGLGLGLFISQEIVMAHRGRIEVLSETGSGADFRIFLPTSQTLVS